MRPVDLYLQTLSRIVPSTPLVRYTAVHRLLNGVPFAKRAKPSLGLFELDPLLGWRLRPNVVACHPSTEFRAIYSTTEHGYRASSSSDQPKLFALGCSQTFGHGVNDEETFPSLLSQHGLPTLNLAVPGYGPAHGYLQLIRRGWLDKASAMPACVLYIWIPDQLIRAWRRKRWIHLNSWVNPDGPSHPVFDLSQGHLEFYGLVGIEGAVEETSESLAVLERIEWRITTSLLKLMYDEASSRNVMFFVVVPPVRPNPAEGQIAADMASALGAMSVPCINLHDSTTPADLFYPYDTHPNPRWHHLVARRLAEELHARA